MSTFIELGNEKIIASKEKGGEFWQGESGWCFLGAANSVIHPLWFRLKSSNGLQSYFVPESHSAQSLPCSISYWVMINLKQAYSQKGGGLKEIERLGVAGPAWLKPLQKVITFTNFSLLMFRWNISIITENKMSSCCHTACGSVWRMFCALFAVVLFSIRLWWRSGLWVWEAWVPRESKIGSDRC